MSHPNCRRLSEEILPAVGQERLAAWTGLPAKGVADRLREHVSPTLVDQLVEEMQGMIEVLPMVCLAAAAAEDRGLDLAIEPRMPGTPIDAARKQRVSMDLSIESDGVTLFVSHLPGRHPALEQAAAELATV